MFFRPVAGYVNLCPESISIKAHDIHQMHSTIKHEILHALVRRILGILSYSEAPLTCNSGDQYNNNISVSVKETC